MRLKDKSMPKGAYIEIVHNSQDCVHNVWRGDQTPSIRAAGWRIVKLEGSSHDVHYYPDGDPRCNLPDIPKNTPVRLGGGLLALGDDSNTRGCVNLRVGAYLAAGFQDVHAVESISITYNCLPKKRK